MFHLGMFHFAVTTKRRVRPDVRMINNRTAANDHRAANARTLHNGALFDNYPALNLRGCIYITIVAGLEYLEHQTVAFKQWVFLAGVNPPTLQYPVMHHFLLIDQPLNCVSDF